MTFAVLSLFLVLSARGAAAIGFCSEPSVPSCLSSMLITGPDELLFSMCHSSMQSYQSDVEEYQACLKRSAQDVVDEYNAAVRKFNCIARGGSMC